jgi:hydroxyacylglutathione hydrolase
VSATVILLADGGTPQIEETRRQLLRVGIDGVAGYVDGGFAAWRAAGLPVTQVSKMSASELHERRSTLNVTLVDVRTRPEFDAGHIPGAIHIPAGEVIGRAGAIPRGLPVATICESGYRSTLAASLLARQGIGPVSTVTGGMTAYRALQTTA